MKRMSSWIDYSFSFSSDEEYMYTHAFVLFPTNLYQCALHLLDHPRYRRRVFLARFALKDYAG